MKFSSRSKSRSGSRRVLSQPTVCEIETCESRLLLTTPNVLSPTGTVSGAAIDFSWEAVDNANSYEVWVSSLETFRQSYYQNNIAGTSISVPSEQLDTGRVRIWVRANLDGGGTSAWSPGSDAIVRSAPVITSPLTLTNDSTPEITWTAPNGSSHFQIWVTDLEKQAETIAAAEAAAAANGTAVTIDSSAFAQVYNVDNRVLDADGNAVRDSGGQTLLREIRSIVLPENPSDFDGASRVFNMGRYRVWIRSFDNSFAATPNDTPAWSTPVTFRVGTQVENLGPTGSTINVSPTLTWDGVDGATHYEVYVREAGGTGAFFRRVIASNGTTGQQSTQIVLSRTGNPIVENGNDTVETSEVPLLDVNGNERLFQLAHTVTTNDQNEDIITVAPAHAQEYIFWVRAIRDLPTINKIYGDWSDSARFSTLTPPTVTGPVPANGLVTAHRPTVTWTPIHGAARYEILIHQQDGRNPFHRATSNTTSYTLTENIRPGTFFVWVRALDTTGDYSGWSSTYQFVSSGGAPVITSPTGGTTQAFLNVEWTPVDDAVSYEIWVSEDRVNFTAYNVQGITTTTFSAADPLNNNIYRIWVRALRTDGTYGPWSQPVVIQGGIVSNEEADEVEEETLLVNLDVFPEDAAGEETTDSSQTRELPPVEAVTYQDELTDEQQMHPAVISRPPARTDIDPVVATKDVTDDLLVQIAENCVDTEWWMPSDAS